MKKVRCPKCDTYIQFDETKYDLGQSLVFVCPDCKKEFGIRLRTSKGTRADLPEEETENVGELVVIENVFAHKQVLPLKMGDNTIGRRNKGVEVDVPIETNDPSMDRIHCILHVGRDKKGKLCYTLRDNDSMTGTFLMNNLLLPKDRLRIADASVFTLGATTLILREPAKDNPTE
ncbi:MAG: FHA domain-containing protein [Phocaeicola sp.]|nr:FHA domain-containing protein [Phocaeicola sp.]